MIAKRATRLLWFVPLAAMLLAAALLPTSASAAQAQAAAPPKPTGVTASPGDRQVTLSWNAIASANGWQYQQRVGGSGWGTWRMIAGSSAATTGHTVSGLTNYQSYGFRVRAFVTAVRHLPGPESDEVAATPIPPPPAAEITTFTPGNAQVNLMWKPLEHATSWEYRFRTDPPGETPGDWEPWYTAPGSNALTNEVWVTNMTNGTRYLIALRARNAAGPGGASLVHATPTSDRPRGAGVTFTAEGGDRRAVLRWFDNDSAVSWEYRYRVGGAAFEQWTGVPDRVPSSGRRAHPSEVYVVEDLTNGTEHTFELRSRSGARRSLSVSAAATPAARTALPPKVSFNVIPTTQRPRQAWLRLGADPEVTSYQYQFRSYAGSCVASPPSGGTWSTWANVPGAAGGEQWWVARMLPLSVTNPVAQTTCYIFRVRGMNNVGAGPHSDFDAGSSQYNSVPTQTPARPTLTATAGLGQVQLAWPAQQGVLSWQYRYAAGDSATSAVWRTVTGSSASTTGQSVTGLDNGTAYTFEARAANSRGLGLASEPVSATPGPTFGSSTIADQTWERNVTDVDLALPEATGGNGELIYALGGRPPPGVRFDGAALKLTGRPTALRAATEYTWTARDTTNGNTATLTFNITVTGLTFTSGAAFSAPENQTVVGTVTATGTSTPTFSLSSGADQAKFSITSAGALTFKDAPDFETPTDVASTTPANAAGNNEYIVVVQAASGTGASRRTATQTVTVTVTDADDRSTGTVRITGTQKVGSTLTADTSGIRDQDGLENVSWSYAWSQRAESDGRFTRLPATSSTLVADTPCVRLRVRVRGSDDQGNPVTHRSGWTGVISGSGVSIVGSPEVGKTLTAVDCVRSNTRFQWYHVDPTTDQIKYGLRNDFKPEYTLTDWDVGKKMQVRANGVLSDITDVVAARSNASLWWPRPSSQFYNVLENTTAVATLRATDSDGDAITYSIPAGLEGGIDGDKFQIDSTTGALSFKVAPDFENSTAANPYVDNLYFLVVRATSGTGSGAATQDVEVVVDVTDAAETAFSVAENQTAVGTVGVAGATSYAIHGGADASQFSINSASGVLTFNTAPNFENPADSDLDNVYRLTVRAALPGAQTSDVGVAITVTDVFNEAPASPPGRVTHLWATHNRTSLTVYWRAQEGATAYDVTYHSIGSTQKATAAEGRVGTSITITCDVRPAQLNQNCVRGGTTYIVNVRARNSAGESDWLDSAPARPPLLGAVDPSTISVTHNGTSLTVSWTAPPGATHYDVTYQGAGVDSRAAWNRAGTSLTITCDIRPGYENQRCVRAEHDYTVGIRARGAGRPSLWVHSTTPARPPGPDAVDASSISVTHNGTSLTVSWDAVSGATHYDVTYQGAGVDSRAAWNRAGTTLTITCDIRPGYENQRCVSAEHGYTVGIRARASGGYSGWVYSTTPATHP